MWSLDHPRQCIDEAMSRTVFLEWSDHLPALTILKEEKWIELLKKAMLLSRDKMRKREKEREIDSQTEIPTGTLCLEGDRSHRGSTASAGSCPASDSSLTPTNSCYGCCLCIMHLHGHHCCVLTCSHDIHPLMAGLSTSYTW
jgi:hypothetical protein